jgi:hypothetical protein
VNGHRAITWTLEYFFFVYHRFHCQRVAFSCAPFTGHHGLEVQPVLLIASFGAADYVLAETESAIFFEELHSFLHLFVAHVILSHWHCEAEVADNACSATHHATQRTRNVVLSLQLSNDCPARISLIDYSFTTGKWCTAFLYSKCFAI